LGAITAPGTSVASVAALRPFNGKSTIRLESTTSLIVDVLVSVC
jgi:hypothetical protein